MGKASSLKDYRPISLIHSIGKLISKLLVNRLVARLSELVHPGQTAFIKGRYIQDSLKFVQASARLLHAQKTLCLLLKWTSLAPLIPLLGYF
jgi:hypothetical protein